MSWQHIILKLNCRSYITGVQYILVLGTRTKIYLGHNYIYELYILHSIQKNSIMTQVN